MKHEWEEKRNACRILFGKPERKRPDTGVDRVIVGLVDS
jgi:hypothetical protein